MQKRLTIPTIHRNGTSQDALLDAVTDAGSALYKALRVLERASPNGRDYYPQGNAALRQAEAEHRSRAERVHSVIKELEQLAEAIADGGHGVAESAEPLAEALGFQGEMP